MNPVLLPKRKEFGFLKPPSTIVSSSITITSLSSSQRKQFEQIHPYQQTQLTAQNHKLNQKDYESKQFNIQNYLFDPLKVKYEISNHLFGKSYTKKQPSISTSNNQIKGEQFHRPAYRGLSGSNGRNQIRRHQIITVPISFNSPNRLANSSKNLNKIDATQFLQQLMNKRREKTMFNQNCRNCGINFFENNRCLYCEYNNSTNVVWLPNLARQQLNPQNEYQNKQQTSIIRPDSSVNVCKTPVNLNKQILSRDKALLGVDSGSKRSFDVQNQREQKVKSTASDYYGDSTVIEDVDDSLDNNKNNVSYNTNEIKNYAASNQFQPFDDNYKYTIEDDEEQDYQNVVPKLTLWLV